MDNSTVHMDMDDSQCFVGFQFESKICYLESSLYRYHDFVLSMMKFD